MRVNAHVSSSPAEAFTFTVGYVLAGLGITVLLSHTEVDDAADEVVSHTRHTHSP